MGSEMCIRDRCKLVAAGVLREVSSPPTCVSPFTVSSRTLPSGTVKRRLCFDGSRSINPALAFIPTKLCHFREASELLLPGDYQASLDLRSFYYHLKISHDSQQYLGVSVLSQDGSPRFFVYCVLPFGIAPAAAIMTRLAKPLIAFLVRQGVRISIYIDDVKINASSLDLLAQHFSLTVSVFERAGFVVAADKSDTRADFSQRKLFLGFIMDSVSMTASASSEKISSVKKFIADLISCSPGPVPIRELAKAAGKLAALQSAFGPFVLLASRSAYYQIAVHTETHGWSSRCVLLPAVISEFSLFLAHADGLNGFPLTQEYRLRAAQTFLDSASVSVASDASGVGVCAYSVQPSSMFFFQRLLSSEECLVSSGHRELLAIKKAIEADEIPHDAAVAWLTDSENVVVFLEKGSSKPAIQSDVLNIFILCKERSISL